MYLWVLFLGALALLLVVLSMVDPTRVACLLLFMTSAFPKAGIKVGGFPFPFCILGLTLGCTLVWLHARRARPRGRGAVSSPSAGSAVSPTVHVTGLFVGWILVRAGWVLTSGGLAAAAPLVAWSLIPVYVFQTLTHTDRATGEKLTKALEYGFIVAVVVGLAQQFFGVLRVQVPGLTYALGDDLTAKRNIIYLGSHSQPGEAFSKIPATYQNGNIFGLVAAFFVALTMQRLVQKTSRRRDGLLMLAGLVSVGLSGSRTAVLAVVCATGYSLWTKRGSVSGRLRIVALTLFSAVAVLVTQPGLLQRYSFDSALASGGSGRTEAWHRAASQLSPTEWFTGVAPWQHYVDGWVGAIQQVGLIGVTLLVLVTVASRPLPASRPGLVVLLTGLVVDSTYALVPTWFIPAALMALAKTTERPEEDGSPSDVSTGDGVRSSSRAGAPGPMGHGS